MKYSQLFGKTVKSARSDFKASSHRLLYKGGFIRQISAGRYAFLPLGFRVWQKIYNVIKEEMDKLGAQQLVTPTLHPIEFWKKTNRDKAFGEEMMVVKDNHGAEFAIGGTAEGMMVELVKKFSPSYRDLPIIIYQFSNKFRDEKRPRGGLLRVREFMMKDAYSFTATEEDSLKIYKQFYDAYLRIAGKFDIKAVPALSVSGAIGGDYNHEFMVPSEAGEGVFYRCKSCKEAWTEDYVLESGKWRVEGGKLKNKEKNKSIKCLRCKNEMIRKRAVEWGHVFKQDHFYTKAHEGYFVDENGEKKLMWMGAYGIGVGRSMATIVETHCDKKGILWPESVSPFAAHLIGLDRTDRTDKIYKDLQKAGVEVLWDDREDTSPGEKFADADLIGCPVRLVVSEKTGEKIEYKRRDSDKTELLTIDILLKRLA